MQPRPIAETRRPPRCGAAFQLPKTAANFISSMREVAPGESCPQSGACRAPRIPYPPAASLCLSSSTLFAGFTRFTRPLRSHPERIRALASSGVSAGSSAKSLAARLVTWGDAMEVPLNFRRRPQVGHLGRCHGGAAELQAPAARDVAFDIVAVGVHVHHGAEARERGFLAGLVHGPHRDHFRELE